MQYLYYKDPKGNFGDDLNPWLWPQLLGEINKNDSCFIGIGSVLNKENPVLKNTEEKNKIVFGAGVRPSVNRENLTIDSKWDIRFLRGPLSSFSLGNKYQYITDAAYALRQLANFEELANVEKKYEISLMPYFKSLNYLNWEKICDKLGFHYISPRSEQGVEHTIKEIASSKYLITEAMHGAIVADILRVPWHRFILTTPYSEGAMVSEFKWLDWLMSIQLNPAEVSFIKFYRKTKIFDFSQKITNKAFHPEFLIKSIVKKDIIRNLGKKKTFYLSANEVVDSIDEKIAKEIARLRGELL